MKNVEVILNWTLNPNSQVKELSNPKVVNPSIYFSTSDTKDKLLADKKEWKMHFSVYVYYGHCTTLPPLFCGLLLTFRLLLLFPAAGRKCSRQMSLIFFCKSSHSSLVLTTIIFLRTTDNSYFLDLQYFLLWFRFSWRCAGARSGIPCRAGTL